MSKARGRVARTAPVTGLISSRRSGESSRTKREPRPRWNTPATGSISGAARARLGASSVPVVAETAKRRSGEEARLVTSRVPAAEAGERHRRHVDGAIVGGGTDDIRAGVGSGVDDAETGEGIDGVVGFHEALAA